VRERPAAGVARLRREQAAVIAATRWGYEPARIRLPDLRQLHIRADAAPVLAFGLPAQDVVARFLRAIECAGV